MTFTSLPFIAFIGVVALAYFAIPARLRWVVLLLASYLFFWFCSGWLVLWLAATTVVTWYAALRIDAVSERMREEPKGRKLTLAEKKAFRAEAKAKSKPWLMLAVLVDLGILVYLKYSNFLIDNANVVLSHLGIAVPRLGLLLPIGISFYTLQAIGYVVDVYRGKCQPDRNVLQFALFMSYFPQIVQGPIPRHEQLAHQLYEPHEFDYLHLCHGCQLILWGWFQKVVIADRVAVPVNAIFGNYADYHGTIVLLAAMGYSLQVYCDFQGGMDIARGFSQILGIDLELNFERPYFSRSIEEFWRRWHITLGAWMRNYVFYPLSLNKRLVRLGRRARQSLGDYVGRRLPSIVSMFVVYLLVGIWHGPQWKYVAYGVWNGVFISAGILLSDAYGRMRDRAGFEEESIGWHAFQMIRTFMLVSLGRLFSRGSGVHAALDMMRSIGQNWWNVSFLLDGTMKELGLSTATWFVLIASTALLLLVDVLHERGVRIRETIDCQHVIFRWIIYILAIEVVLLLGIYGPAYDASSFIYEKF